MLVPMSGQAVVSPEASATVTVAAFPLILVEQDSTAPDASTPSGKDEAEQLAPFAASAVAVEAFPVKAPIKLDVVSAFVVAL
jgi:hypothetical protein